MHRPTASATPATPTAQSWWLATLAAEEAPQLFAIAHEYPETQEGWVAAYGMAFQDRAEVSSTDGDFRTCSASPESALTTFTRLARDEKGVKLHLIWLTPPHGSRPRTNAQP
ncbi:MULTISPECIES: hypothetical protein [Actinosynnema]|uniref:Uncharacterized protein n=1 Tax=Actinosynnema pretiosum TaxID=42197 RepID=A0A290ZAU9_9PSEU|nr:hypothetical protein [Actinosynnema pretiosum]ATE56103.1 hypothetical protein CNX65_24850 [Actinosynnema pretiosum]